MTLWTIAPKEFSFTIFQKSLRNFYYLWPSKRFLRTYKETVFQLQVVGWEWQEVGVVLAIWNKLTSKKIVLMINHCWQVLFVNLLTLQNFILQNKSPAIYRGLSIYKFLQVKKLCSSSFYCRKKSIKYIQFFYKIWFYSLVMPLLSLPLCQ